MNKPTLTARTAFALSDTVTPQSRRRFLQKLGAVSALAAGGGVVSACRSGSDDMVSSPTGWASAPDVDPAGAGRILPGAVDGRVLIVVDLLGGNDGLSTLVPAGSGRYYDLRPDLAVPDDEVLGLDDDVGLHPALVRLHQRGITTVEGVGPVNGDLSHFAMVERWERGDVAGEAHQRTGFLGRLADALDDGSPLVGVSLDGPTPHLGSDIAATMSLGSANDLWFLEPTDWSDALAYQYGVSAFQTDGHVLGTTTATSYEMLMDLAADLASSGGGSDVDWELPMISDGGSLGQQLYLAADLIAADVGTRVIYAGHGDFDTHSGHVWRQDQNLAELDAAVDGFLRRADDLGFADKVLVATISEFGRRVEENNDGLDHGSASTMVMAGPVGNDRRGERPPLDDLDDDGNLRVTAGFDRYLATLAESWLGVEAASVLPGEPQPLPL